MKKAILGGTFDILHKGHKILIKKAFSIADEVVIGLTSDSFSKKIKKRKINPYLKRKEHLKKFIEKEIGKKAKIIKIENIFGPTLKKDFDFIVVSPETYKKAILINFERKKINKKPIKIFKIDYVLADDGKPISCSRIIKGEIDKEGRECLFCQIVKGKRECHTVYEDKKFLAFLDSKPRNEGHTLLIPKKHFRWVWDISWLGEYFELAGKIANGIKKATGTDWVISPILGGEIFHAHLHLIPKFEGEELEAIPASKSISEKRMKIIAEKIRKEIKKR